MLHRIKFHLSVDEIIRESTNQLMLANVQNRAKSNYLSNMSHELRTPMNAIIGMTAIGIASDNKEQMKYALEKIEDASTLLLGIINDILDLSKIEAGKFELISEDFSFEKMIERAVNVISFRVEEKNQELGLHLDRNIPSVLNGDSRRLTQVITNLLGNAVKFTPNGGSVSLDAAFIGEADGVCELLIKVVDSGIGINLEQQARLFQSFEQADSSTSSKFGGTGLGLAISKSIVEMMGGRIWVESEIGQGAAFTFTVRIKRGDAQAYEISIRETSWKGLRILAVDDNSGILGYVKNFVERFGAFCDTAPCGSDAIALVEQNRPYDIFFIDWKMPDMDALQLAEHLNTVYPEQKKTIITMVSSTRWEDIEEKAKGAGIDAFLSKPLFPSAITNIINEFLGVVQRQIDEVAENSEVSFEGKCLLLVEDMEINSEIMFAVLAPTLVCIDCAVNGKEAVRMFADDPDKYDMILMDIQMPEMDGYEATRKIRALEVPAAKSIPIVAMTANVFTEDIKKCLEAGMNDHLGKPLDTEELMGKLRRYLT